MLQRKPAEPSLVPTVALQSLQPDGFELLNVTFRSRVTQETPTNLSRSRASIESGPGGVVPISGARTIELTAVIPKPGGVRVFALGRLAMPGGHQLRSR